MENDPSKKESKGKRIFKKAIRRNSKQSNNSSQNSALEQGIGVSRSKSFENKRGSIEINDSAPLPTPDGTKEKLDAAQKVKLDDNTLNQECALPSLEQPTDAGHKKNIQDARNQNKATPSGSNKGVKISSPKLEIKDERPSGAAPGVKKSLKRVGFQNHVFTISLSTKATILTKVFSTHCSVVIDAVLKLRVMFSRLQCVLLIGHVCSR